MKSAMEIFSKLIFLYLVVRTKCDINEDIEQLKVDNTTLDIIVIGNIKLSNKIASSLNESPWLENNETLHNDDQQKIDAIIINTHSNNDRLKKQYQNLGLDVRNDILQHCNDVSFYHAVYGKAMNSSQLILNRIDKMYNEEFKAIGKIFNWIEGCPSAHHRLVGYLALYEAIEGSSRDTINDWTLKFAKLILPLTRGEPVVELQKYGAALMNLRVKIPNCVAKVVFSEPEALFIRNEKYGEYFYASDILENQNRRNVFSRPLSKMSFGGSKWYAEVVEDENGSRLALRNARYDEYVFVSQFYNPTGNHILYMWTPKADGFKSEWILEPSATDLAGNRCYMRYRWSGEYLCAYDQMFYNTPNRRVFTRHVNSTNMADGCLFEFESKTVAGLRVYFNVN